MNNYAQINLLKPKQLGEVLDGYSRVFFEKQRKKSVKKNQKFSHKNKWARLLHQMSVGMFVAALLFAGLIYVPKIVTALESSFNQRYIQILSRPSKTFGQNLIEAGLKEPEALYQPVLDPTLSTQNSLVIEKIGVKSQINESTQEKVEEALKKGVWRVSGFGTPYSRKQPVIMASHRFGYLDWDNEYRRENSFYNLPKLEEGDRVEIIWNQRKYVYEIYDQGEGEEITDYHADLILYTCRFLDSDVRIFRYARLLEI